MKKITLGGVEAYEGSIFERILLLEVLSVTGRRILTVSVVQCQSVYLEVKISPIPTFYL